MRLDEELLAVFTAEVDEQLGRIRHAVAAPASTWDVRSLRGLAHNVKGAARMVGAGEIRDAAHGLENALFALPGDRSPTEDEGQAVRDRAHELSARFELFLAEQALPADQDRASSALGQDRGRPPPVAAPVGSGASEGLGPTGPDAAAVATVRLPVTRIDRLIALAEELAESAQREHDHQQAVTRCIRAVEELARSQPALRGEAAFSALRREVRTLGRLQAQHALRGGRLVRQLDGAIRALRMVPLDSLGALFERVVVEAAEETGHHAELVLAGVDTEIDRALLDRLRDPLVHLLRNAVAHGIEPPDERLRRGKRGLGTVRLEARVVSAHVELSVEDDGRGVDLERVRERAVAGGLIEVERRAAASEAELHELLFRPTFSTVDAPGTIAGRGVGLDVVRKHVDEVGGRIVVRSQAGVGTCFTLRVPLTRFVSQGVALRLGPVWLVAPVEGIERTILAGPEDVRRVDGRDVFSVGGHPVAVRDLERLLRLPADGLLRRPAVILSDGADRVACLVDAVLGAAEFVAQPLPWNLQRVPGVAGAAVLEGGRLALLLDVAALVAAGGASSQSAPARGSERRRRILVADDSITSRTLERNILAAAGYDVLVAEQGEQAWSLLQEEDVDLVITDIEMPQLDGLSLTRRIRAEPRWRALPIILVTSLGNEEHRRAGAEAGANAYVTKGVFDQDELLRHVARLL